MDLTRRSSPLTIGRLGALCLAAALFGACGGGDDQGDLEATSSEAAGDIGRDEADFADSAPDEVETEDFSSDEASADQSRADEVDPDEPAPGEHSSNQAALTRSDVDCDGAALGDGNEFVFITAHFVVDGELGAICFGEEDPSVALAWNELAAITPRLQLADLALFAGFVTDESDDDVTLAFVNSVDDDGTAFQMSINLDSYDEDPAEASLTIAHEFSHVFTAVPTQLDRSVTSAECDTYFSGEGCYLDDAVMAQWVEQFWTGGLLADVDPFADPSPTDGDQRCEAEPGFLGSYAATNPEEDFAESFSAYVFRVPAPTEAVQAKFDWIDAQPGLAEFRDRADDAGLTPLDGNFELCG